MTAFDPRLTAARPDLAASALRGLVDAPRFVEGDRKIVFDGAADLRRAPVPDAPLDTEALHGEIFTVYETDDEGWSWGQLERDSYVGYMPSKALTTDLVKPSHRVSVLRTFLYGGPSIKLPPTAVLSLGSRLTIAGQRDAFSITHRGHYVMTSHINGIDRHEPDFVAVAERFVGVPYYWGGKTSLGLDCSGLVQIALDAAGIDVPRDTDMQERAVGTPIPLAPDLAGLARGDLVFWKGHVGIMRDAANLLHANGHHMLVVSEPLREAVDRTLAKGAGPITSVRRLALLGAQ